MEEKEFITKPIINIGDTVISDHDGLHYTVIDVGPRDKLTPLPGVTLIGDVIIVKSKDDNTLLGLFPWEVTVVT